jgi:hypothetical protein
MEQPVIRRPEIADDFPIGDCPRNDISGVWKGTDGVEMTLSQRGSYPRGYVKGGRLEGSANELSGTFDGKTFSGPIKQRGGRSIFTGKFTLAFTAEGRLRGTWEVPADDRKPRSGEWNLTRVGPGPPAPRPH